MGQWVWRNDDGSIEVPPNDLANHLTQSVNTYKNQQQGKVSQTGAYVQYPGTTQQNMVQFGQQLNSQQRQPVAYWNPNTNVVYAGGMPTQMPQVVPIGYGYSPGYGTAPLVYDMAQGQYVGGSMNQFGPTGNATVPMITETTITPAASNNTSTKTKKSKETQNTSSNDNSFAEEIVNNAINNSTNTSSVSIPLQLSPNPPLNYTTIETSENTTDEVVNPSLSGDITENTSSLIMSNPTVEEVKESWRNASDTQKLLWFLEKLGLRKSGQLDNTNWMDV